jgi:hypothetical protein
MPKVVKIRYAAKTGKYKRGNGRVRDPVRVQVVKAELDRLYKLRKEATKRAEGQNLSRFVRLSFDGLPPYRF